MSKKIINMNNNNNIQKDFIFVIPADFPGGVTSYVGSLILGTKLDQANIGVDFITFGHSEYWLQDFNKFLNDIVNKILEKKPKIVSFYIRVDIMHVQMAIAKKLKAIDPTIVTLVGGPPTSLEGRNILIAHRDILDFVCAGEGDSTIVPFVTSLLANKPDLNIDGLIYYKDNNIIENKLPEPLPDNYSLEPDIYYLVPKEEMPESIAIDVGRGCPFSCNFCSINAIWHKTYKLRNLEDIINTIKLVNTKYGINSFQFVHDNFTVNKARITEFCHLLQKENLDIQWSISARIDCVDKDLIKLMKDTGLISIFFGIETGSQSFQYKINKNLKLDSLFDILDYCLSLNVDTYWSFIYGQPGETEEDFKQTVDLIFNIQSRHYTNVTCGFHEFNLDYGSYYYPYYKDKLKFIPGRIKADLVCTFGMDECLDFILAYPDLYFGFYSYEDGLAIKYKYACLYLILLVDTPTASYYLLKDIDKVKFIEELNNIVPNNILTTGLLIAPANELLELCKFIILTYVDKYLSTDKAAKIRELINYEQHLNSYRTGEVEGPEPTIFNFNIAAALQHKDNIEGRTELKLQTLVDKYGNKKLKIYTKSLN